MDENQSNLPDQSIPDATHVEAAGGAAAVDETLSLAELNTILGKNYKDKATALSAVKETYKYVGKKLEPASSAAPDLMAKVSSLEEELFYTNNPDYKPFRDAIAATGKRPTEAISDPALKGLFEKAKAADAVQQRQSVVHSNQRLGVSKTITDEALNVANATGTSRDDVAGVFAKAISEALQS